MFVLEYLEIVFEWYLSAMLSDVWEIVRGRSEVLLGHFRGCKNSANTNHGMCSRVANSIIS